VLFKGSWSAIACLGLVALVLVVSAAAVMVAGDVGGEQAGGSFPEDVWITLTRTLDPGTIAGDAGWGFRLVSVVVAVSGVLILSALIGLMTSAVERKVSELQRGKTFVAVSGHTLILGWSPKVATIIRELCIANESEPGRSHIVVLAPKDKLEMEQEIRLRLSADEHKTTVVHYRTGIPASSVDLAIANPSGARSVIVVSPEGPAADANVMKTALAVYTLADLHADAPVIAELVGPRRAMALRSATQGRVLTVVSSDTVARIAARVCRHHGLSAVFQELLDFAGHEIYVKPSGKFIGETFGTALMSFSTSTIIGLVHEPTDPETGVALRDVVLCPPMAQTILATDSLIAISQDDTTVVPDPGLHHLTGIVDLRDGAQSTVQERILVLGWSGLGPRILESLAPYLRPGSAIHALHDPELIAGTDIERPDIPDEIHFTVGTGDTIDPATVEAAIGAHQADHILILCYRRGVEMAEADARALMTLLLVRAALSRDSRDEPVSVVTELLDMGDVGLAGDGNAEDFVVSERLTSLLLSQLSEDDRLEDVFAQLLGSSTVEVAMRDVGSDVPAGAPIMIRAVTTTVAGSQEVLIGYAKKRPEGPDRVVVNPKKDEVVTFGPEDHLVVLRRRGSDADLLADTEVAGLEQGANAR
jgi:hypothetical protein